MTQHDVWDSRRPFFAYHVRRGAQARLARISSRRGQPGAGPRYSLPNTEKSPDLPIIFGSEPNDFFVFIFFCYKILFYFPLRWGMASVPPPPPWLRLWSQHVPGETDTECCMSFIKSHKLTNDKINKYANFDGFWYENKGATFTCSKLLSKWKETC